MARLSAPSVIPASGAGFDYRVERGGDAVGLLRCTSSAGEGMAWLAYIRTLHNPLLVGEFTGKGAKQAAINRVLDFDRAQHFAASCLAHPERRHRL